MGEIDFNAFLKLMVQQCASDMFISADVVPSFKLQGRIVPFAKQALSAQQAQDLVFSVMTPAQREELTHTHECQFAIDSQDIGRFRASCFYQRGCVGMVLRLIESNIPRLDALGLPTVVENLALSNSGIMMIVGATGTGKSTTQAALVNHLNEHTNGHIITLEDPIEFVHQNHGCIITQREIGIDTDNWGNALKNTLRQSPDVILIGEVRTRETMEYAIHFAESGHLCLCTLHASNADQAIDRVVHFFPENRHQQVFRDISMNLRGIVAQQLIPSRDGKTRHLVTEVLLGTPLVRDYIRQGEIHKIKEVMQESGHLGMQTFDQGLIDLYQADQISYEDALHYADSANEVRLRIKLNQRGNPDTPSPGPGGLELEDPVRSHTRHGRIGS